MSNKVTSDDIKNTRNKLNLNQKELGELLGVTMRTIQNWESGKRNIPEWVNIQIRNFGVNKNNDVQKKELLESQTETYIDVSNKNILTLDEIALFAAQNIDKLKTKSVFYNTFVMEALSLLKEAQNEDGSIDPIKLTYKS